MEPTDICLGAQIGGGNRWPVPRLRKGIAPVLLLAADLHLRHAPPVARSQEPNWYISMRQLLGQLEAIASEHHVPIAYAGDIFHHWDSPSELVNFALSVLPSGYSIPGNHDLPLHAYADMPKSSYWTLVQAGKLRDIGINAGIRTTSGVYLYGFPWGSPLKALRNKPTDGLTVALVHAYIWMKDHTYPGAKEESHVVSYRSAAQSYDLVAFGDNHKGFLYEGDGCKILNCGGFYRSRIDEADYKPSVGLLLSDGSVRRVFLDTSRDVLSASHLPSTKGISTEALIQAYAALGAEPLDFPSSVARHLNDNNVRKSVRKIVLECLE